MLKGIESRNKQNPNDPIHWIFHFTRMINSFFVFYMGVSKNRGTPKWMVYKENPIKMDDLGVPPF